MNDVIINKVQSIQRCVFRAREEYGFNPKGFAEDYSRQDAAILHVIRGCEQAIDLANHLVRQLKLGIPTSSRDSFQRLGEQGVIGRDLAESLGRMAHFRNFAVHQYEKINIDIVAEVITKKLDDLVQFGDEVIDYCRLSEE
ncbi:MAG: DUF86 domain-containing protein [Candidatus Electrothrix scaldis]|nr:MAG: DUF86 domain-containing protein [Candidatus Electrothrix sp. GW3-3]